ncbi:Fatty acid-binding-like protein 5 [Aphelenchoides bicaudatus]|nr:Fatty acid-binding-like protein 5 [Aphelenchoides bicaudatus]
MSFDKFVGKWNLAETDHFDDYMKKIGVGFFARKLVGIVKPVLTIESTGDHWKITSSSTFRTTVTEFDIDREFEETTPVGHKMKSICSFDGDKLVKQQKAINAGEKASIHERYIDGDKLVLICKCEDVTGKLVYQRDKSEKAAC